MKLFRVIFSFLIICFPSFSSEPLPYYIIGGIGFTGFFSEFFEVIGAIDILERTETAGFEVNFENRGIYYQSTLGNNFWEYYFDPIKVEFQKENKPTLFPVGYSTYARREMPLIRGKEIIDTYIRIKPHIQKEIGDFLENCFNGFHILGIHYRGTDKHLDSPKVDYDLFVAQISKYLDSITGPKKIFVATDECDFLNYIRAKFGDLVMACDIERSVKGEPIHYRGVNQYYYGKTALIDCLLISHCDFLICNVSNLNRASRFFNPNLRAIELNKHYCD